MKHLYFSLILLIANQVSATDCVNCMTDYIRPIMNVQDPIQLINIEKVRYKTNPKASFCKRPEKIIDTIVIHHSQTPTTSTPEDINEMHLKNGKPSDPWYMIAYSYVVNSPYPGNTSPRARVTEGRPINLVGAHAGTDAFVPATPEQIQMVKNGSITCGKENETFKPAYDSVKDGKIKANVSTIGLVVIGNYAPYSSLNLQGYRGNPRLPSNGTLDMAAKTACQLQKTYPSIKYIKWHSYYHSTSCPGILKNYITNIKNLAGKYGCEFN